MFRSSVSSVEFDDFIIASRKNSTVLSAAFLNHRYLVRVIIRTFSFDPLLDGGALLIFALNNKLVVNSNKRRQKLTERYFRSIRSSSLLRLSRVSTSAVGADTGVGVGVSIVVGGVGVGGGWIIHISFNLADCPLSSA